MKSIIIAISLALISPVYADDCTTISCSRIMQELNNSKPDVWVPPQPQPFYETQPAQTPESRNSGGWASCSYGVCNGFNNDGSSWWSSNAGGTTQYFYNQ